MTYGRKISYDVTIPHFNVIKRHGENNARPQESLVREVSTKRKCEENIMNALLTRAKQTICSGSERD